MSYGVEEDEKCAECGGEMEYYQEFGGRVTGHRCRECGHKIED